MIKSMKYFRMVIIKGGFRAAATELNVSPSLVTRHVGLLEEKLKTQLLKRNTRTVTLTDKGVLFFNQSLQVLEAYEKCMHQVVEENDELKGKLKIGIPHSINHEFILPALGEFYQQHSNIKLDIISGNHSLKLFSHEFDLALHCGNLPDSNLYFTSLGYWGKHTCVSKEYIDKNGEPKTPADLEHHNCLVHFDNRAKSWQYIIENQAVDFPVSGTTIINNSLDILKLVTLGGGVSYLPEFTIRHALDAGKVVTVLDDYMPPPLPMFVVHINPALSKKEQVFVDFLKSLKLAKYETTLAM